MINLQYREMKTLFGNTVLSAALLLSASFMHAQVERSGIALQPGDLYDVSDFRPLDPSLHYNRRHLRDSTYVYEAERTDSTEEWSVKMRKVHHYDASGKEREMVASVMEDDLWKEDYKLEFSYRQATELENTVVYRPGADGESWEMRERLTYSYTYAGLENDVLTEHRDGERWLSVSLVEQMYNEADLREEFVVYGWSDTNLDWIPEERTLFVYKALTNLTQSERVQSWDTVSGEWVNTFQRNFFYDDDENLIEAVKSTWDSENGRFVPVSHTEWAYNHEGLQLNMITVPAEGFDHQSAEVSGAEFTEHNALYSDEGNLDQVVITEWNEDVDDWLPVRFEEHFWSEYITGTDIAENTDISCIFANPYTIGLPWNCEGLMRDVQYSFELFDLAGRLYYADTFKGGNSFRVRGHVPPGIYVAVLTGGMDRHAEKVIVR